MCTLSVYCDRCCTVGDGELLELTGFMLALSLEPRCAHDYTSMLVELVERMKKLIPVLESMPSEAYVPIQAHMSALESAVAAWTRKSALMGTPGSHKDGDAGVPLHEIIRGSADKMREDGNEFVLTRLLSQRERDRLAEEAQLREEADEFVDKLVEPFIGKRQRVSSGRGSALQLASQGSSPKK